jgi:soluble P-type ATPase
VHSGAPNRGVVVLDVPGTRPRRLEHLVIDFNGTLARDGALLPGVAGRLRRLARRMQVTVLTADTFGTARHALRLLPVTVRACRIGTEKRRFVRARGRNVVAVGNGRNDLEMFRQAALAIAVIGPEGAVAGVLGSASIIVNDVRDALDLLLKPLRLTATLRE